MRNVLKIKIISYIIFICLLLNVSLYSITLNSKLDLSAMFSCAASTFSYAYNPIQLAQGLQDNLVDSLYKTSDKQNSHKKDTDKNTGKEKKNDFIITSFSGYQTQTIKQFNNPVYETLAAKHRWRLNNLHFDFLNNDSALFVFYLMMLAWFAILFRKRWNNILKNIYFVQKNI
ncbi:MAG: hypothetical protein FWF00_03155 [Endomicrobia bacterium]|nr:hypothetical protein [Endomicrobiia bacterium]MCL2506674.1 hypothetical protein [Endomicrobiia bacterium]